MKGEGREKEREDNEENNEGNNEENNEEINKKRKTIKFYHWQYSLLLIYHIAQTFHPNAKECGSRGKCI